jgi:tripartite-type tricarboxylate transporter receptor subunit TctC
MSTLAINPVIYKGLAYQPMKDLTPITQAVTFANVLVASNDLPVNIAWPSWRSTSRPTPRR